MEHKGFLGLTLCGIGVFASDYFNLINSTIFFGCMSGGVLFVLSVKYIMDF